jgi:hypothetical protein
VKRLPFWKRPYFARRILDIGAGHNPFQGVTHVLEIDPAQGGQRGWNKLLVPESSKLIVGDTTALPFQSGSFDYVYAAHVLEHVDSPESACREIMRVGAAGYIETPSPFLEQGLVFSETVHKWFVYLINPGVLVFEPRTEKTIFEFCSCPDGRFMQEFYASVKFDEAQHYFRRRAKTTIFYWRSTFQIEVRDRTADCTRDRRLCRFRGMKRALLSNCNDVFRAPRLVRFSQTFPGCKGVFRKFGHRTVFVR